MQHFDENITTHSHQQTYTSLQIQHTQKEAHLTPTDISEDRIEHTFQNISSAMWAIYEVCMLNRMPEQAFQRDYKVHIYVCNSCLNFVRGKGENLCVGGIRCYFHPFHAVSFE